MSTLKVEKIQHPNSASVTLTLDANGRLGLGTSSPNSLLQVYNAGGLSTITIGGDAASSYSQLQLRNSSAKYNWSLSAQNNVDNGFEITPSTAAGGSTFSTPVVVVKYDGKVGVGTSTPGYPLDVNGVSRFGNTSGLLIGYGTAHAAGQADIYTAGTTPVGIGTTGSAALNFYTNSTLRATVDTSGRVGIGTTTPDAIFGIGDVQGGTRFHFSRASYSEIFGGFNHLGDSGGFGIYNVNSSVDRSIRFLRGSSYAGLSESARFDSSGRLLVGTSNGQAQFVVHDTSTSVATTRIFKNAASTQSLPALVLDKLDNTNTTAQIFLQCSINNQQVAQGQINANGASQLAFGTYSDRRLKENILDLPSQWDAIKTLRPVEFDYIQSEGGGHQVGFVAQEVQEVYPDVVGERSDGMLTLTGMGKNESRLIKALQEAMERIEALEAEVAALKV